MENSKVNNNHFQIKLTVMNIKKLLQFVMCILMATAINAQRTYTDWGEIWSDTSKISAVYMPQQIEFLNNQYPYPAKPRNQWELGFGAGVSSVTGDMRSDP